MKRIQYIALALAAIFMVVGMGAPKGTYAQGTNRAYKTGLVIQNLDPETANISIAYYQENSTAVANTASTTIAASGSVTLVPLDNFAGAFAGSGVVSSDKRVAAIVNIVSPDLAASFGGDSYVGFPSGSKNLSLPIIFKSFFNFTTFFNIQNTTATDANVTITFRAVGGAPIEQKAVIKANSSLRFDQTNSALPNNFNGSATVTSDQDIVAAVMQVGPTTILGYSAFTTTSTNPVAPIINANNFGYFTGFNIQNAGTVDTTVTVTYSASQAGTDCTETLTIPAGGRASFAQAAFANTVAGENCANGAKFIGSGRVTTNSANQPLIAVVNQLNSVANKGGTYRAFDASVATSIIAFPIIQDRFFGFFTGISVTNVGTVATPLSCTFTNSAVTQGVASLEPGKTFTAQQLNTIADKYNGSATCTASAAGAKIVGVSQQLKNSASDTFLVQEGINK